MIIVRRTCSTFSNLIITVQSVHCTPTAFYRFVSDHDSTVNNYRTRQYPILPRRYFIIRERFRLSSPRRRKWKIVFLSYTYNILVSYDMIVHDKFVLYNWKPLIAAWIACEQYIRSWNVQGSMTTRKLLQYVLRRKINIHHPIIKLMEPKVLT